MILQEIKSNFKPFERQVPLLFSTRGNTLCTVWTMPISWEPSIIVSSIGHARHTFDLLEIQSPAQVGVIKPECVEQAIQVFGRQSGRDVVKPSMDSYCSHICKGVITRVMNVGDHALVFVRVQEWMNLC